MEHFYSFIDSENWFNYKNFYSSIVRKYNNGAKFVEVGTWKGSSACFMAVEIINSNKDISFDCVDTWEYVETSIEISPEQCKGLFETFLKNIDPVKDKINIVKSISWEAAKLYKDESVDFVFIDAGHDYESVKKDLNAWYPKVKIGGTIAGHDYHYNVGVYPAVNEFFKDKHNISQDGSCWIVEKTI